MRSAFTLAALVTLGIGASAQDIEDFEHGNMGLYAINTNPGPVLNMSITPGAAHDGALGAQFDYPSGGPVWYYRPDVLTEPGGTYWGYTRTSETGALWFGVGATATGGTVTVNANMNSGTLRLYNDAGWGMSTLTYVPFTFSPNTWYRLGLEWLDDGQIRGRLWDEAGSPLAETPFAESPVGAGGIAFRAFNNYGNNPWFFDTVVPEPASLLLLLPGGVALMRRRPLRG